MKQWIANLNSVDDAAFIEHLTPALERYHPLLKRVLANRPFLNFQDLFERITIHIDSFGEEEKLALIKQFPRLADPQPLAEYSRREHIAAGINRLADHEHREFCRGNLAYVEKFAFPFVVCARDYGKAKIIELFARRLANSVADEIDEAIRQIKRIFWHRLTELSKGTGES